MPNDPDILKEVIDIAINLDRFDLVSKVILDITKIPLKNLLTIAYNLDSLKNIKYRKQVKNIDNSKIPAAFHDVLYVVFKRDNFLSILS